MVKYYYQILGLNFDASLSEVEERYHCLMEEFDPEQQQGDLKEFFKNEQKRVKEAYTNILEYSEELKEENKKAVVVSKKKIARNKKYIFKKSQLFVVFLFFLGFSYLLYLERKYQDLSNDVHNLQSQLDMAIIQIEALQKNKKDKEISQKETWDDPDSFIQILKDTPDFEEQLLKLDKENQVNINQK